MTRQQGRQRAMFAVGLRFVAIVLADADKAPVHVIKDLGRWASFGRAHSGVKWSPSFQFNSRALSKEGELIEGRTEAGPAQA